MRRHRRSRLIVVSFNHYHTIAHLFLEVRPLESIFLGMIWQHLRLFHAHKTQPIGTSCNELLPLGKEFFGF